MEMEGTESYRRLLSCMECPFANTLNLSSRSDCIRLVTWLEDRKIRKLEKDQREVFRTESNVWDSSFSLYLDGLDCPYVWPADSKDCLVWLIGYSVAVEYESCAEICEDNASVQLISDDMIVDADAVPTADSGSNSCHIDSIGSLLGFPRQEQESNPGLFILFLLNAINIGRAVTDQHFQLFFTSALQHLYQHFLYLKSAI